MNDPVSLPHFSRLYLHFPFCEARCHYCDFYALAKDRTAASEPEAFVKSLRHEIELSLDQIQNPIDSIFMGGGTPSLTDPDELEYIFEPLLKNKTLSPSIEWTSECNPSSLNLENLKRMKSLGINRISLGVQAFQEPLLKLLGRVHDQKAVFQAVENIHTAKIKNFSIDLMCGIPGQTLKDLEQSLTLALSTGLTHLSCYILTLAQHHPMFKDLPNENTQLEHYLFLAEFMKNHGFEHYEVSNFSRPGLESQHNLAYWQNESYLGLGPSAHSFDSKTQTRFKNISSLKKYISTLKKPELPREQFERLTPENQKLEKWMLNLRLSNGISQEWVTGPKMSAKVVAFQKEGLIEIHPTQSKRLRLTARGFTLSDQIAVEFSSLSQ